MAPKNKTPEETAAEEKEQKDFLSDAAEVDDTLDFDLEDEGGEGGAADKPKDGADGDDASGTQITDADIDSVKDGELGTPTQTPEKPAGTEAPTTETPTTPTETPTQPTTEQAQQPTTQTKETQAPTTAPAADAPAFSQEQVQQVYKEWRDTTEGLLADHHYNLKQEDVEALELEPAKVIPRIMAKVYLDAVTASIGQITMHLPRLVRIVNEQTQAMQQSENAFFERWPVLKSTKGGVDTVIKLGQTYRAQNPAATEQDFINEVGAAAMVALRLDPSVKTNGNGTVPATAPKPGFVPATGTPQGGIPKVQPSANPFEQLNRDFDTIEEIDLE